MAALLFSSLVPKNCLELLVGTCASCASCTWREKPRTQNSEELDASLEPKAGQELSARQELPELLVVDDLLIGRERSLEPKAGE
jgi:hypothetical protein